MFLPINGGRVLLETLHVVTTARHGGDGDGTVGEGRSAVARVESIGWD